MQREDACATSWSPSGRQVVSWSRMVLVFDGIQWYSMVLNGIQMVSPGLVWSQIGSDGLGRSRMISVGLG